MDHPLKQTQTSRERFFNFLTLLRIRISCAAHALFDLKTADTERRMKQDLLTELNHSLSNIRATRSAFREATDSDLIEALIFELKSEEARYNFLLKKAKDAELTRSARHQ
ncbi:MAG: DUF2508 family protein [Ruminococcaceae bacterium]|nr:DUF2508 family protein [Oscillospiraceae bacterium]